MNQGACEAQKRAFVETCAVRQFGKRQRGIGRSECKQDRARAVEHSDRVLGFVFRRIWGWHRGSFTFELSSWILLLRSGADILSFGAWAFAATNKSSRADAVEQDPFPEILMKKRVAMIAGFILLGAASAAFAQDPINDLCEKGAELQTALSFYDNNDYGRAATAFEDLATAGDPCGQYWLAEMYHNGQGVPRDQVKYHDWLNKSAAQGYSKARIRLSLINQ